MRVTKIAIAVLIVIGAVQFRAQAVSAAPSPAPSQPHVSPSPPSQGAQPQSLPLRFSSRIEAAKMHIDTTPVRRTSVPLANLPSQAGTNVLVSYAAQVDFSETAIAYDPTAHANLEAGANNVTNNTSFPGGFNSSNSGAAWGISNPNVPSAPPNTFGSDPGIVFDGSGNLYYSFVSANSDASSVELVVQSSMTKGVSWSNPIVVDGPNSNMDKPLLGVDSTSGSPFYNRKYLGYDYANGNLRFAFSDDGVNWTRTSVYSTNNTQIWRLSRC